MQDGASGGTNPGFDVLLTVTRELGEHAARIGAAEEGLTQANGEVKRAVVAVQEATKEMSFFRSSIPTAEECDARHAKVATKVVEKLTPIIAANGNGTPALAPEAIKRSFFPRDFLGIAKMIGIIVGIVVGAVLFGGWLADRGLLPGHDADGIQVTAYPEDPLREDLRRLLEALERGAHGPTSASSDAEPDWSRMGLEDAAAAAEVEGG